jgi:hypothetical protein
MFKNENNAYRIKILKRFKEDFDEAQSDNHDIKYATDMVIKFYNDNYPSLKEDIDSEMEWYLTLKTDFEERN